jgi:acetyltransferase
LAPERALGVLSVPGELAATLTIESTSMKDGAAFEIRPIRQDDEERMIQFHQGLSERSVYMRYFESMSLKTRTAHARLVRVCYADPERETVLVAVTRHAGEERIVAVGRLSKFDDPAKAEIALLVLDGFQDRGLGSELLRRLIVAAREQKITQIEGEMLRDNIAMQKLMKKFGFRQRLIDPGCVRAVLDL